jgi:hypothetical protein
VLYIYLVPHVIVELKQLLLAFLERGGRVVTYVHNLGYVFSVPHQRRVRDQLWYGN